MNLRPKPPKLPIDIRVMVIDDQRTMRSILRQLLDQCGISQVMEAEDGEDALVKLREAGADKPDIVICDLHMAKMDGMDFVAHIRRGKEPVDPHLPILILTGDSDKLLREVTEQVGATRVLLKPISAPALLNEIGNALGFSF